MEFANKRVLVAGTGKSGIASAALLKKKGAAVLLYDENESVSKSDVKEKLKSVGEVEIILGALADDVIAGLDLMVISPGIPKDAAFVQRVEKQGITIWGEIELSYQAGKGKIAAITGTNGKTTTTYLLGEIFAAFYEKTFVVGNIGFPYADMALQTTEDSVIAAEISSFQLESIDEFQPEVSAVLNITPDHLNRHYTMENYTAVKMNITKNQTQEQFCVLNYEDEWLKPYFSKLRAKPVFFSSSHKLTDGYWLSDNLDDIYYSEDGKDTLLCKMRETNLLGIHNAENIMAAIAMSVCMGVPMKTILAVVRKFKAVEHRIEFVEEIQGVTYYNDSKGTNTDASKQAIRAMNRPCILIAGGYDKGSEYDDWVECFGDKVKALVLLGVTKDKIAKTAKEHGFEDIVLVDSLKEAVEKAAQLAQPGEAVLLSPACASWDMFQSFEERGNLFKEYVREIS